MPSAVDVAFLGRSSRRASGTPATPRNSRHLCGRRGSGAGLEEGRVMPGVLLASMDDDDGGDRDDDDDEILVSAICRSAVGHASIGYVSQMFRRKLKVNCLSCTVSCST